MYKLLYICLLFFLLVALHRYEVSVDRFSEFPVSISASALSLFRQLLNSDTVCVCACVRVCDIQFEISKQIILKADKVLHMYNFLMYSAA